MKPPDKTAVSHKANVIKLTAKPAFAHLDFLLSRATIPTKNMKGGPNMMRIPPRNPRTVPHPKPGIPSIPATPKNQGDTAKTKLFFPIEVDFILLSSLLYRTPLIPDVDSFISP